MATNIDFDISTAVLIPSDTDNCWICFVSYADDKESGISSLCWSAPCGCKGSTKWVHQECLQQWVDGKQRGDPSASIKCSQCHTVYKFNFPVLDPMAQVIIKSEAFFDFISPYACFCFISVSSYLAMTGYGYLAMVQVVGFNNTNEMLDSIDPGLVMVLLPIIPVALFSLKFIRLEDILFQYSKSIIPYMVSFIFGEKLFRKFWPANRKPYHTATKTSIKFPRMIFSAMMLPTISYIAGYLLFPHVKTQFKRSILGGLFYTGFRLVVKLYSKYQYYQKISNREIVNFPHTS